MLGEFDGVANQVQQNLTKPRLIAAKAAPGRRFDEHADVDPLLVGFRRQQADSGFDGVGELEIDDFEVDLAGLELRDVQNVVDQGEQRFGAVAHRDRTFALFRCQIGLQQQPIHPNDAVHRRTNLVGHIGQEIRFGAVRLFGGFTCRLEARPILLELAKLSTELSEKDNEAEDCAHRADCNECRLPAPIRESGSL